MYDGNWFQMFQKQRIDNSNIWNSSNLMESDLTLHYDCKIVWRKYHRLNIIIMDKWFNLNYQKYLLEGSCNPNCLNLKCGSSSDIPKENGLRNVYERIYKTYYGIWLLRWIIVYLSMHEMNRDSIFKTGDVKTILFLMRYSIG